MQDKSTALSNCLPFIIGVTGHRDIDVTNQDLRQSIEYALRAWRNHIDDNTPIWLLNGLAVGADLLVAEVALKLQKEWGQDKLKIIGCLPMPEEHYKADFESPDATEKFESVVAQIEAGNGEVFAVRATLRDSDYQYAIKNCGELRNSLYLNQGLFVAKYSNILLSLWDGKAANGAGGTADVTNYKLGKKIYWPTNTENSSLEPISDFDGQISGLVHHIPVKRDSKEEEAPLKKIPGVTPSSYGNPSTPGTLYDSAQNESHFSSFITDEFSKLIEQLKTYNSMVADYCTEKEKEKEKEKESNTQQSLHETADVVAEKYQQKYRKIILEFFLITIPGYICYEVIGGAASMEVRGGLIFIVLLIIMAVSWKVRNAAKLDLKWKYQLARGVAEGVRIRSGLNLADVPPSSAPLIPRTYRPHLVLLNHAISITELEWWRIPEPYSKENFGVIVKREEANISISKLESKWVGIVRMVKKDWIKNQRDFLNTRLLMTCERPPDSDENKTPPPLKLGDRITNFLYKRPKLAADKTKAWAKYLFFAAIVCGVLLFVLLLSQYFMTVARFNHLNTPLMYLVQFCLMFAGVIALWRELAGYESTAKGYLSLNELYDRADNLLEGEFTTSKHQMLLDLAREAIFEHVSWTMSESNNDLKHK